MHLRLLLHELILLLPNFQQMPLPLDHGWHRGLNGRFAFEGGSLIYVVLSLSGREQRQIYFVIQIQALHHISFLIVVVNWLEVSVPDVSLL